MASSIFVLLRINPRKSVMFIMLFLLYDLTVDMAKTWVSLQSRIVYVNLRRCSVYWIVVPIFIEKKQCFDY